MGVKYTNNAKTTISSGINNSVTTIPVASSSGFPSLSGSDYFYATLDDATNLEVVKVTAVSGTNWTVVRAQDDTTARAWSSGDDIELRLNAALLTDVVNDAMSDAFTRQAFTGDGSTTAFTLSKAPATENDLIVFIEGVFQTQSAYSVSGTTLTFSAAPANSREIIVYNITAAVNGDSLSQNNFTGDGSDTTFTLGTDPLHENNTMVFLDGVYQHKSTYSVSGTTLTFSTAPASGVAIECITHTQTEVNTPASNSVVTASIVDDNVTQAKIADDAVGADQLAASAVVTASIVDDNVTQAKIADDAVGADQLASSAVVTASIVDDAVTTAKIADDQVTLAKMAGIARGKIIYGDSSGNPAALSVGSANQVLTSDGTDVAWAASQVEESPAFTGNVTVGGTLGVTGVTTSNAGVVVDELTIDADTITATDDFIIDATTNIFLDADGGEVVLRDGGTNFGYFHQDSDNFEILSTRSDGDIIIKGNDGGSTIAALTLDMSDAGTATFNHDIKLGDDSELVLGDGTDLKFYHSSSVNYIKTNSDLPLKIWDAGGAGILEMTPNGKVGIFHNGSEKIYTTSTGAVIAHNSDTDYSSTGEPAGILTLYNSNGSDGGGVNNYSSLEFNTGDGATSQGFINYIRTADNQGSFAFSQRTGSSSYAEAMRIDGTGLVGIGTTAPTDYNSHAENLVVASSGNTGITIAAGTSSDSTLMFADGTGGTAGYRGRVGYDHATDAMNFHTSASQHMRIQSDGIVVISSGAETFVPTIKHSGAVGDLSKLRVINRSGQSSNKGGLLELGGVTDDGVSRSDVFGAIAGLKNNATSANREGYMAFYTNDGDSLDEYMRLTAAGVLCIGTTSPISNSVVTVHGGDMMVKGDNNSCGISDLLPGYTRGDYGVVHSTANHVYFSVGSSYVSYINGGNGTFNVSDQRLKENVATLTGTLDKVKQLRGVSFTWKDTEERGTDTAIGLIAQEVETIYPELVDDGGLPKDNEGNDPYKSVNYAHLTSVLIEAIKELSTELDAAKARITTLEG